MVAGFMVVGTLFGVVSLCVASRSMVRLGLEESQRNLETNHEEKQLATQLDKNRRSLLYDSLQESLQSKPSKHRLGPQLSHVPTLARITQQPSTENEAKDQ